METLRRLEARQAYGFCYLRPEREADALEAVLHTVAEAAGAFEQYLGPVAMGALPGARTLEVLLAPLHYDVRRDGQGRIVHLMRRDGVPLDVLLEDRLLHALLAHADGAALVFSDPFGNAVEWRAAQGEVTRREGKLCVAPSSPEAEG